MTIKLSEFNKAILLANRLLNEPNCDPDDDLRLLSRNLLRAAESIAALKMQLLERSAVETNADPYLVRTFWSPDRRHLVSAHVTREGIVALQDDNGQEWEAAGPQQDMNAEKSSTGPDLI